MLLQQIYIFNFFQNPYNSKTKQFDRFITGDN